MALDPKNHVGPYGCALGTDPELFFEKNGKVIGAEKVLPGDGELVSNWRGVLGKTVLDGVQAEFNLAATFCRETLGSQIAQAFCTLRTHLKSMDGVKISFRSNVEVDREELDSLSPKSRILGCAPSMNYYVNGSGIGVDPETYRKRSAGGHMHFGLTPYRISLPNQIECVPVLDAIVGNTCVMLDRDPLAAERRQVYGRAGEYRLPPHGLEYRTLSNFWLRNYKLMHFVFGMGRLAIGVGLNQPWAGEKWKSRETLLESIDSEAIQHAINTNDLQLAKENWKAVRAFIDRYVPASGTLPVSSATLPLFDHFLKVTESKGLEYWFPEDPLEDWCNFAGGRYTGPNKPARDMGEGSVEGHGWERFLQEKVALDLSRGDQPFNARTSPVTEVRVSA